MGVLIPQVVTESSASGAQMVDGSLKFDSGSSNYLNRTPSSAGNRKTWTWSGWVKRNKLGATQFLFEAGSADTATDRFLVRFQSDDTLLVTVAQANNRLTSQVFRDVASWGHLVIAVDTTQSTANDRSKIYWNGSQITNFSTITNPNQDAITAVNSAAAHSIGKTHIDNSNYLDGYQSNIYLIDGQALGPENFGYTDGLTGTWRPKKFSGDTTYPNNINTNFSSSLSASSGFNASYPANNAFDGNLESFASSAGGSQYLELSSSFTGVTSLRIQCAAGSGFNMGGETYTISGTGITSKVISTDGEAKSLTSISLTSTTISGIRVTSSSGLQARIVAIEINGIILKNNAGWGLNGFYLPMDGNSPIGHDKSNPNPVNNGTTWSAGTLAGTIESARPWQLGFDGNLSTFTRPGNGVMASIVFDTPISFSSKFEIKGTLDSGSLGGYEILDGSDSWINVTSSFGNVTSDPTDYPKVNLTSSITSPVKGIRFNGVSASSQPRFTAVYVDDVILIDGMYGNGWTPKGFGGSVALPKATGAKPILNTDGGGNVARPGVFGSESKIYYTLTSGTNSGGKYVFENEGTQPVLNLIRGVTYEFDYSAASGHPLRFATAADAAGSTEYTDGTNTATSNVFKITVPHNAPNTLYYYCTNHSGMGNSISITTDETKADPYAWKCVLAAPLIGGFGDDVSADINVTTTTKAVTNYGSTDSSAVSNFYGSSRKFDGSNDNINYAASADLGFDGDFTIECFCTPGTTGNDSNAIIASKGYYNTGNNWYFKFNDQDGGHMQWFSHVGTGSGENLNINNLGTTDANRIYHIAVTRESNVMRFYLDGVKIGNGTYSRNYSDGANNGLTLARQPSGNSANSAHGWYDGYISDLRIYKGVAKYTSDFVVASTSPDILPDTPSGVSGSSKLAKITDGAVSFDGSGDYLSVPNSSDFTFGTGDFTLEYFINTTDTNFNVMHPDSATGTGYWGHIVQSSSFNWNDAYNSSNKWNVDATPILTGGWHHCAICRASGTTKVFFDGVSQSATGGSFSDSTDYSGVDGWEIGGSGNLNDFNGFISNFRVIKGTALYTSNFTPSTAPLTNVTNTKLLCCQETKGGGGAAVSPTQSGFNTSASWSSTAIQNNPDTDRPIQHLFDGTTSNLIAAPSGNNATNRINLGRSITATTSLRFYLNAGGYNNGKVTVFNGGTEVGSVTAESSQASGFYSLDAGSFPLTFTAIQVSRSSDGYGSGMSQIEVDSSILKDPVARFGDASATTFNPFNTDINTVRGQETGYATFNPLDMGPNGALSDGNLNFKSSTSSWSETKSTINIPTTGKWYVEQIYRGGSSNLSPGSWGARYSFFGVCTNNYVFGSAGGANCLVLSDNNNISKFGTQTAASGAVTKGPGGTVSLALNRDDNTYEFFYQGVSIDSGTIGTTDSELFFMVGHYPGNTTSFDFNFGQKPFKFPPPDGFQPLNLANIRPETVITHPDQYVGVVAYTGDGNSPREIGGFGFQPDLVVYKERSEARDWQWYDSVRGVGPAKNLVSNTTYVETANDDTQYGYTSSFNKNGFTVTNGTGGGNANIYTNKNGQTYASWTWRAGGNKGNFNVDNVGYENASDVGMNVGGQNSNAYDQTQTWSSGVSGAVAGSPYDATKMFDGSLTTYTDHNAQNSTITWTYTLTGVTSLKVYIHQGNSTGTVTTVGGDGTQTDTISTNFGPDWHNITLGTTGSTINSIAFTRGGSGNPLSIYAVEVNGVMYVDNGVTPPGAPSIAPTGSSVGTKQGFSIVKYTGNQTAAATVPHGLSQIPDFAIVKQLTGTSEQWRVRHKSTPDFNKTLFLNLTNAQTTNTEYISNFSSTTVTLSSGLNGINGANSYIMYVWHDVPGLQKFGSCKGSGASAAPDFVELGFKPSIVWVKRTDNTSNWTVWDSSRSTSNPSQKLLYLNTSGSEQDVAADAIDILSNGFAIRSSSAITQTGSQTYIYCAWAEAPTVNLFGAQSNAR